MVPILNSNGKLLYEQVYEFYRDAITGGRLKTNEKLPSHRKLAKELQIGNNTVIRAFEQLIHEGYIKNERRRGLFVANLRVSDWLLPNGQKKFTDFKQKKVDTKSKPDFKLTDQVIDEKKFPIKEWRKCTNRALDRINFQYDDNNLSDPLKVQLQNYLFQARGVASTPDRIIIGSGTNSLLFWLAFILRKTHSKIVFEDPCYPRPRDLFSEFGFKTIPVSVNNEGIDIQKLQKQKADLLYLTPSHQFPTGGAVPVGNRYQILNWAKKNKAYVLEDDFDCEFRYKSKLMPSLQGLDNDNRVIYLGTFSNAIMPSLRVSYMVLPEKFPIDVKTFGYLTQTVPNITRRTLAYFMEDGYWERHLKKMRKVYHEKYQICISSLKKLPKNLILFNETPSGLNILLRVNTRLSDREILKRALEHGVSIKPANEFYAEKTNHPKKPAVLFEFGNLESQQIPKVVEKLYRAWV
jgi:GntR family transcriptional regulator / MocR family aminotransferase